MTRSPDFRPSMLPLEARWLPSASPYPDPYRDALQASYVAQADQAANPVVFLGDSITYNWGTSSRWAPGQPVFATAFSPLGAANFSVYGDTSKNVLDRVLGGDLNGKPKVAVVMVGVNDLAVGESPLQAATGVATVVGAIRGLSPQTSVLLLGVLPTGIAPLNAEIQQLNAYLSRVGSLPGVTFKDPGYAMNGPGGVARPGLIFSDNVHPTGSMYYYLANSIEKTVDRMLTDVVYLPGLSAPVPTESKSIPIPVPPAAATAPLIPPKPAVASAPAAVPAVTSVEYLPLPAVADSSTGVGAGGLLAENGPTTKAKSHSTT